MGDERREQNNRACDPSRFRQLVIDRSVLIYHVSSNSRSADLLRKTLKLQSSNCEGDHVHELRLPESGF